MESRNTKPSPIIGDGSSTKWKVGDTVLCLHDEDISLKNVYTMGIVERGRLYKVTGFTNYRELGLILEGKPCYGVNGDPVGWKASRFKKVTSSTLHLLRKKKPTTFYKSRVLVGPRNRKKL